ncbi:hypothetical protein DFP97_12292 [Paenibacillus prosopidis]|uniref:Uncharacterized protein n=1 Tax=Paenibacillus prosopidis TaxID=630520 RepID=A0A368VLT1_9BACL|nr:hypothetical protein DFP97_12292 [Paenibacillus prosopidis]
MFGKSLGEIFEIIGVVLSIGIVVFLLIWGLISGLSGDMSDTFNNIQMPS